MRLRDDVKSVCGEDTRASRDAKGFLPRIGLNGGFLQGGSRDRRLYPEGIASFSPGLARRTYPGNIRPNDPNHNVVSSGGGSTLTPMLNSEFRADEPRISRISRIEFRSIPNFSSTSFGGKPFCKKIRSIRVIRGFPVRIVGFNFGFRAQAGDAC